MPNIRRGSPSTAKACSTCCKRIDAELAREFVGNSRGKQRPFVPIPGTAAPIIAVADFLGALQEFGLLRPTQLNEVREEVAESRFTDVLALARELLRRESLTAYQFDLLLEGRGRELILGSYLLLGRLGEGGAGQVFKARHLQTQRVVALKVLLKELLADAEVVRRFYREIRIISGLDHPNVVHAYDAGQVGETHFL